MNAHDVLYELPNAVERFLAAFDDLDGAEDRDVAIAALREARSVRLAVEPLAIAAGNYVRDERQRARETSTRVRAVKRAPADDVEDGGWASDRALELAEDML